MSTYMMIMMQIAAPVMVANMFLMFVALLLYIIDNVNDSEGGMH